MSKYKEMKVWARIERAMKEGAKTPDEILEWMRKKRMKCCTSDEIEEIRDKYERKTCAGNLRVIVGRENKRL